MAEIFYAGIGSRQTPEAVCKLMNRIARAMWLQDMTLSSGGAIGADTAFENGSFDLNEIWTVHNDGKRLVKSRHGCRPVFYEAGPALELTRKFHHTWNRCTPYAKLLHARNAHIILGADLKTPVSRVICWTEDGKVKGGTGQGLRIAKEYGIPIDNLCLGDVSEKYKRLADDTTFPD